MPSRSTPGKLASAAKAWKPTPSDAFTAVVVMVPTMNEYFGQWKVSRFVLGAKAKGDCVQRRLEALGHPRHPHGPDA